jgi:hypothetical protein
VDARSERHGPGGPVEEVHEVRSRRYGPARSGGTVLEERSKRYRPESTDQPGPWRGPRGTVHAVPSRRYRPGGDPGIQDVPSGRYHPGGTVQEVPYGPRGAVQEALSRKICPGGAVQEARSGSSVKGLQFRTRGQAGTFARALVLKFRPGHPPAQAVGQDVGPTSTTGLWCGRACAERRPADVKHMVHIV